MEGRVDDGAVVALARAGDQRAFADLVDRHRTATWSVCLRITGNSHDAEDALQDALTAAWSHLDRFRGDSRFGTWLYRIAANASLAVVRRRREVTMEELPVAAYERDLAVEIADRDEVQAALAGLPPIFREALVLREIGDLTYQDIAAHQGVPVQTVKSRLNRGRAALAEALSAGERAQGGRASAFVPAVVGPRPTRVSSSSTGALPGATAPRSASSRKRSGPCR